MEGSVSLEQVIASPHLPSLPAVALQVLQLTRDENVKLADIAKAIQSDQALAARVLRTVNSSYYGLRKPCPTVTRAIGYLGLNTVKTLVLCLSVVDTVDGGSTEFDITFDFISYWRRAVYSAAAARYIARFTDSCDPEEAFLAALMQDIGMIALWRVHDEKYLQAVDVAGKDHRVIIKIETESFEYDHTQVGAMMCEKWRLPQGYIDAIRYHHDAEKSPDDTRKFTRVIEASMLASLVLSKENSKEIMTAFISKMSQWFSLSESQIKELLKDVSEDGVKVARLLNVDMGGKSNVAVVMDTAHELLLKQQIEQEQGRNHAEEEQEGSEHDAMIHDRMFFEQALATAHQKCKDKGGTITLLIIGADEIETINRTDGYEAGDKAVRKLGKLIIETFGDKAMISRYVSSHFAIMMQNIDYNDVNLAVTTLKKKLIADPIAIVPSEDTQKSAELNNQNVLTVCVGASQFDSGTPVENLHWNEFLDAAITAFHETREVGINQTKMVNPDYCKVENKQQDAA